MGKEHYGRPPWTNKFRSAAFHTETNVIFFTKQPILRWRYTVLAIITFSTTRESLLSRKDLLRLTSSDQLLLTLNLDFSFFYKTSYLYEEINCRWAFPFGKVSLGWRTAISMTILRSSRVLSWNTIHHFFSFFVGGNSISRKECYVLTKSLFWCIRTQPTTRLAHQGHPTLV
jgi:hypothetical protein